MKIPCKKVASPQSATLLKISPNEFFKDIDHYNGTPCFKEYLLVAASKLESREDNAFSGLIGVGQIRIISIQKNSNYKPHR